MILFVILTVVFGVMMHMLNKVLKDVDDMFEKENKGQNEIIFKYD